MPLSALTSTTARYEKAGFAKPVDASATMGADLALARFFLNDCRCHPTRRFSSNLAYDRLVFNGLLFMAGLGNDPVQVYRTLRDLHWVEFTF